MNRFSPFLVVSSTILISTLMLNGCGSKSETSVSDSSKTQSQKVAQNHLNAFLSLHNKFCEKKYPSSDVLKKNLETSPELKLAKNFDGVYEALVGNVSYAVSPEEDGCTTDVMLKSSGKELFTFEEINQALIKLGYVESGKSISRKDRGTDQSELLVIEKKYISPEGEVTTLDFPLEKKDKYYMTLFVEKFTEAKREIKEKALKSLKMASR